MDGSPLDYGFFTQYMHSPLLKVGVDPKGYSGHSFRRGAASSAATLGLTDLEIQQLGRWRSDAYKLPQPLVSSHLHVGFIGPVLLLSISLFSSLRLSASLLLWFEHGPVSFRTCERAGDTNRSSFGPSREWRTETSRYGRFFDN